MSAALDGRAERAEAISEVDEVSLGEVRVVCDADDVSIENIRVIFGNVADSFQKPARCAPPTTRASKTSG